MKAMVRRSTIARSASPVLQGNPALLADWTASKRIPQTIVTPNPSGSADTTVGATGAPQSRTPSAPESTKAAA
jgi:hypothetical protein